MPPDKLSDGTLPSVSSYKEQEITSEKTALEGAARSEAKYIEEAEEKAVQLHILFSKAAKTKSPCPSWVRGELAESLYRGIHHRAVENAFFDSRLLIPREQFANCVSVAVTTLVTSRVATLKAVDAKEVERSAVCELLRGLSTLSAIGDFEHRRRVTVQAVTRAVIEQCVQLLNDWESLAAPRPGRTFTTSDAGPGEVVVRANP